MRRALFVILTIVCVCTGQDYVNIQTSYGTVKGVSLESTNEFLGIPFAQPPLGSLRFAPPLPFVPPNDPNNYVQEATTYKSACIQDISTIYTFPGQPSEDCLYLNIYTPKNVDINTPKPVMVWIHGGAFVGGSATQDSYNASIIVQKGDVVVVTINYRLGVLGYGAISEFCSQSAHCGFYGILDQQLALQWVQQNINSFGGNPNNVTIFGESAGAMSVAIHLASSSSAGLFQAALMESGLAEGYPTLNNALVVGDTVVELVGCNLETSEEIISCMQAASADVILQAQKTAADEFWPVINNYDLYFQPIDYLYNDDYNKVPLLIGCNTNEGWLFAVGLYPPPVTEAEFIEIAYENFGEYAPQVIAEYPISEYDSYFSAVNYIIGDYIFVCQTQFIIEAISTDSTAFMYLFNHTPSYAIPASGAFHASEIPFVYGYAAGEQFTPEEEILSNNMTTWWTTFAKNHQPHDFSLPFWPQYRLSTPYRIVLNTTGVEYIPSYRASQCEFWRTYYNIYEKEESPSKLLRKLLTKHQSWQVSKKIL